MGQDVGPHSRAHFYRWENRGGWKMMATLHFGGSTPFNEVSLRSHVLRRENAGRTVFPPGCQLYLLGTRRGSAFSAGPCSQPHKMLSCICQWGNSVCSCSSRCWLPGSPGNPGVLQVSSSALERWPSSPMHVARSTEWSCVPPRWEDNDFAGFYGA